MATKKETFINKALSYVGKGPTKFRQWYYGSDLKGVPWCAVFVSYVAQQAGILGKIIKRCEGAGNFPREGVPAGWGKWYEGNTTPQAGDLIFFCWNGKGDYKNEGGDKYVSDHVGVVYKVDKEFVYTVEGNTDGSNDTSTVTKRRYYIGDKYINGYYRPDWSKVETTASTATQTNTTVTVRDKLEVGQTGLDIRCLKALLMVAHDLGLCQRRMTEGTDYAGPGMADAIKQCQKAMGHKETGIADAAFVDALYLKIKESYPVPGTPGDFDGDGKVTIKDATAIQKDLAGIE